MPVSSYSSAVSWSVYLAASLALLGVCSPALDGVRGYAYGNAAAETAKGVEQVFDGLSPGVKVAFTFSSPVSGGELDLRGHDITVVWGGVSSTRESSWPLPDKTLRPEARYYLELVDGRVEVLDFVRD